MGWFSSDKPTKYAQALLKVSANLWEASTDGARPDHAPLTLRFERPDSRLRYLAFCLGTTYYFSFRNDSRSVLEQALQMSWEHVARLAMDPDSAKDFFSGPVNTAQAIQDGHSEVGGAVQAWKEYADHVAAQKAAGQSPKRDDASARIICAMLRRIESSAPLTDEDVRRLTPLARWIEETVGSIAVSVEQLAR